MGCIAIAIATGGLASSYRILIHVPLTRNNNNNKHIVINNKIIINIYDSFVDDKSPQATSLPNRFSSAPKEKKSRIIPTGCVGPINEATQTYTYLTHQQRPNHHPPNHHNALVTHLPSPHSPRRPPLPPKIPHRPSSPLVSPPPPPPLPPSHVHNTLQQSPPHQTISRTFSHLFSHFDHHHINIHVDINVNDDENKFTTSSQSSILFSYCSREKYV